MGGYYGVIERGDKQIWRSLKTNGRKLAERHLNELLRQTAALLADLGCKSRELISLTSTKVTASTEDALDERQAPPFWNRTASHSLPNAKPHHAPKHPGLNETATVYR